MSFAVSYLSSDLINLLLYCVQQLGVTLGVGAETIILVAYVSAMRDGIIDKQEAQFARAVKRVMYTGLMLVLLSGIAITGLTLFAGQEATVYAPAYLFKVLLIALLFIVPMAIRKQSLSAGMWEGFEGATWYALFVVHILAPVALWSQLITIYIVWSIGFVVLWVSILKSLSGKSSSVSTARPVASSPTEKKPVQPPPMQKASPPAQAPSMTRVTPVVPPPQPMVQKPAPPAPVPSPAPTPPPQPIVHKPAPPPMPVPQKPVHTPVNTLPLQKNPLSPVTSFVPQDSTEAMKDANLDATDISGLPKMHVMPKTPEDLEKQRRSANPDAPTISNPI